MERNVEAGATRRRAKKQAHPPSTRRHTTGKDKAYAASPGSFEVREEPIDW